jgi:hypothetical protein
MLRGSSCYPRLEGIFSPGKKKKQVSIPDEVQKGELHYMSSFWFFVRFLS